MRYKPGDVVRAVMRIRDDRGDLEKGDLCIVRASIDIGNATGDWADLGGGARAYRRNRSPLVLCSVVHLRGGKDTLVPESALEPVGKNDDAI